MRGCSQMLAALLSSTTAKLANALTLRLSACPHFSCSGTTPPQRCLRKQQVRSSYTRAHTASTDGHRNASARLTHVSTCQHPLATLLHRCPNLCPVFCRFCVITPNQTTNKHNKTGAGQDLMLVAGPERCSSYLMEADTRAVHTVPSCKGPTGPCVAVGGKAYLLGRHGAAAVSCFDPYVSCW